METVCLEKTLFHDGAALLHYRLLAPSGEGVFSFALPMTEGYRDYLEGAFFDRLVSAYDADTARRKRYRYKRVEVSQRYSVREEDGLVTLRFFVQENDRAFSFALSFDLASGTVLRPKKKGKGKRRGKAKAQIVEKKA